MNRAELYEELMMSYEELSEYLIKKYGGALCDYFATPECRSKSKKISRTKEGLYCHHIDEDKGSNLANPETARKQPYEWQKKERLAYCNILEHFILHMKIVIEENTKKVLENPSDIYYCFGASPGLFFVAHEINDMFMNEGTSVAWKKRCFEEIKDNYEEYIIIIKAMLAYQDAKYVGERKQSSLVSGNTINIEGHSFKIIGVDKKRDLLRLKFPDGMERIVSSHFAGENLTCTDYENSVIKELATSDGIFYEKIYEDIFNCNQLSKVQKVVEAIQKSLYSL